MCAANPGVPSLIAPLNSAADSDYSCVDLRSSCRYCDSNLTIVTPGHVQLDAASLERPRFHTRLFLHGVSPNLKSITTAFQFHFRPEKARGRGITIIITVIARPFRCAVILRLPFLKSPRPRRQHTSRTFHPRHPTKRKLSVFSVTGAQISAACFIQGFAHHTTPTQRVRLSLEVIGTVVQGGLRLLPSLVVLSRRLLGAVLPCAFWASIPTRFARTIADAGCGGVSSNGK